MTLLRDLVYGISGSGKTSWWARLAQHLWDTKGLRTRWYLGDGGGHTLTVAGVLPFVDVMPYNLWDHPLETCQKISEGWWPQDVTQPNSPLRPTPHDAFAQYGLFVYEGTSVMSDYIMGDRIGGLAQRMAKGEALNKDFSFSLKDGDLQFGGNARTHYGFTQRRIVDVIERTRALPVHVGWTAHERKVEDEDYREVWIGPDVAGKLLTTKLGASFGNTIHLQSVKGMRKMTDPLTKKQIEQVVLERRAYTRSHADPEGGHFARYYANTRIPPIVAEQLPDFVPEWVKPDPLLYYALLQEATQKASELKLAVPPSLTL